VSEESGAPISYIDIVLPGDQIPRWFSNQRVGTSITLDPSPIIHDNNWIGIVCGVVFVKSPHTPMSTPSFSGIIRFERRPYISSLSLKIPINFYSSSVVVGLHHLWLLYLSRAEFFSYFKIDETLLLYGIKMQTSDVVFGGFDVKVCNCGYKWVFEKDLDNLNPTKMSKRHFNTRVRDRGSSLLCLEDGH